MYTMTPLGSAVASYDASVVITIVMTLMSFIIKATCEFIRRATDYNVQIAFTNISSNPYLVLFNNYFPPSILSVPY